MLNLLQHPACAVLLQQPCITEEDTALVCMLLCTSKAAGAAVARHCRGQLQIRFDGGSQNQQQLRHFARWLCQHGVLIGQLQLDLRYYQERPYHKYSETDDPKQQVCLQAVQTVAAALRSAGRAAATEEAAEQLAPPATAAEAGQPAPHAGLLLDSCKVQTQYCLAREILEQLPCNRLTSLKVECWSRDPIVASEADYSRMQQAIASLTALQQLALRLYGTYSMDPLMMGLPSLCKLTSLELFDLERKALLNVLPSQLQQLKVDVSTAAASAADQTDAMQLGHLTALTSIASTRACYIFVVDIQQEDVLPPHLHWLEVGTCVAVEPLLCLKQLQRLEMRDSSTDAQQLQNLARHVPSLRHVELEYAPGLEAATIPNPAAAGWSSLASSLRRIFIGRPDASESLQCGFSALAVQHLGQLKVLTSLALYDCDVDASVQQLAATLVSLRCLQDVALGRLEFAAEEDGDSEGEGGLRQEEGDTIMPLIDALAGLPALCDMHLAGVPFGGGKLALKMATLTQLTNLSLYQCTLRDFDVTYIAQRLTGLLAFEVQDETHMVLSTSLSDAPLAVIAMHLQRLTCLSLSGDGVTDVGVQCLTSLQRLERLDLHCPHVTEEGRRGVGRESYNYAVYR